MEDDKLYQSALRALVNFKVVDNNKKLLINADDKEWLTKVKKVYEQRYPGNKYVLQNFAVIVLHRNTVSGAVKWVKTKGFSLWEGKGSIVESA